MNRALEVHKCITPQMRVRSLSRLPITTAREGHEIIARPVKRIRPYQEQKYQGGGTIQCGLSFRVNPSANRQNSLLP
jgi:hypothetical protein